jgi:phospholipid transport system transporter-binding protein
VGEIIEQGNTWHVSGDLLVDNVTQVLKVTESFNASSEVILDFSNVADVDTAAISFILELQRRAKGNQQVIKLSNLPANLVSLMQLYGVDAFIH